MLLVHLSALLLNCNLAAQCSLIPEGEVNIVAALAPAAPKLRHNTLAMVTGELLPQSRSQASVHAATKSDKV
jgi:hypothetical protein